MKIIKKYPLLFTFAFITLLLFIIDFIVPDSSYSEMENRYLEKRPKISVDSLIQNKYSLKYEAYINDQFIGRNIWIDVKSRLEALMGKIENNGVVYGKDNYLFEKYKSLDETKLENNVKYVKEFLINNNDLHISFSVIPNSYQILSDKVPIGLNNINQLDYINNIYLNLNANNVRLINFTDILKEKKDEYIFYRTDHHWTTLGAYYAYTEYIKQLGLTPVNINIIKSTEINNFYGSYYSKAKNKNVKQDTINYYNVPVEGVVIDEKAVNGIYDNDAFDKRDKYAGLLRGNNGLTIIKSNGNINKSNEKTSKVLVVKDSYANSFVPFLVYNYDEIYVIDLRSYNKSFSDLIKSIKFDDILIMYNFMNFVNDNNIYKLNQ